ncbi:MAG: gliding motility-associated C-terminal domain-containing protein [Muribaculaceae bacterium]|nr:gliding motility-associated C-terminal domain-containing protein [Muribaculaceae bacterium]
MNKRIIMLMAAALALLSASGQVTFTGVGQYPVIEVTPDISTGLNKIYVVYDTQGVGMNYASQLGERAIWYSYDSRGGGYAEEMNGVTWDGYSTTLPQVRPNTGYIIEVGTDRFYCWVVNYADYFASLNDMFCESENPCSLLTLKVDGIAHEIPYTTINGRPMVLDRELELSYSTLVWDDSTHWQDNTVIEKFESLDDGIQVDQPLCNTVFRLSGDRFLKEWGLEEVVESRYYETQAVGCGTTAVQEDRGNNNEKGLDNGLGGSAPVHIVFTGYPTDAVVYRVWEIATDPEMEEVILQFNQDELDYTFNDAGTYYVRYMVANAAGTCESYGETYQVTVSESELVCPNVFSPGCTEGVNDIWKVSYKSLVEFHCWIFNRWGNLVCEFTDPGSGWDGTYHGKLVDTGVYYYVVTATGSDGVKYKKRGDITILRYTKGAGAAGGGTEGGTGGGEY